METYTKTPQKASAGAPQTSKQSCLIQVSFLQPSSVRLLLLERMWVGSQPTPFIIPCALKKGVSITIIQFLLFNPFNSKTVWLQL